MPIILATQEAENRRMAVQSQPGHIVHKTLSQKKPLHKKAGGVAQGVDETSKSRGEYSSLPHRSSRVKLPQFCETLNFTMM
jgi:hypothetical protein